MSMLVRFAQNRSGAVAIEYAVIASVVSIAIIAGAILVGQKLSEIFTGLSGNLT